MNGNNNVFLVLLVVMGHPRFRSLVWISTQNVNKFQNTESTKTVWNFKTGYLATYSLLLIPDHSRKYPRHLLSYCILAISFVLLVLAKA